MNSEESIRKCYDLVSQEYGASYYSELANKPLDKYLLSRFAQENNAKGILLDLACGPGHTTQYLFESGAKSVRGIDLSQNLIAYARRHNFNGLDFSEGNMLSLRFSEKEIGSIVCLYGIVHFTEKELEKAFLEMHRVLKSGGQLLLSFHAGTEINRLDEFLGKAVEITFYYFEKEKLEGMLRKIGFKIKEAFIRNPYENEYPSQRAYILAEK